METLILGCCRPKLIEFCFKKTLMPSSHVLQAISDWMEKIKLGLRRSVELSYFDDNKDRVSE